MLSLRHRTQLVQHAQTIEQPAEFRDLAGSDAVEHEARYRYLPSRRRDSLELSLVGPTPCPPLADPVLFRDHLFQGGMPVGERTSQGTRERRESIEAHLPYARNNNYG